MNIQLILTDVDGVLTDGGIIYDNNFQEYKRFNVKDGLIVRPLQKMGIRVGVITGRNSEVVRKRCEELNFDFHFHGIKNKLEIYEQIKKTTQLDDTQIAYIGDDWNDLPLLRRVGLSFAPADANEQVLQEVKVVLKSAGGEGAFREAAQLILKKQGLLEAALNLYLA
ncbi:KdsC family phosphatase [Hugenholtzia roseola]|uniref:KdsC family phosphatase n=1 Tax=Hugenholtzia roseola TaxID=1002 RepID=UPI0004077563|nr:HAD-IIIA family hydrolase [Hugenholtzia roseola]